MTTLPPLVLLLQLIQRTRQTSTMAELHFVMVNETHTLTPYRQAVLWNATGEVIALSGIPVIDSQVPFVLWLKQLFLQIRHAPTTTPIQMSGHDAPNSLHDVWSDWLPDQAMAIPLQAGETLLGWLMLAREEPFSEAESELLTHLAEAYAYAWQCHLQKSKPAWWHRPIPKRKRWLTIIVLLGLLLSWRVPLTVLAPAEIVPSHPEVIRAPMNGVVSYFHIQPNDPIAIGQPLLSLDDTTLKNQLEVAEKSLAIAESENIMPLRGKKSKSKAKS